LRQTNIKFPLRCYFLQLRCIPTYILNIAEKRTPPAQNIGRQREREEVKATETLIMRPTQQTAFLIAFALKRVEAGAPVGEVCRTSGISKATFDRWKRKYSGLTPAELNRLRWLERENHKLKIALVNLVLDIDYRRHPSKRSDVDPSLGIRINKCN
jgi:putative transposase